MNIFRRKDALRQCRPVFANINIQRSASEHRSTKSKSSEAIGFTDKPDVNLINRNYIGPADKISNLRPVLRHIPEDETAIERDLRLKQSEVEQWNQEFWTKHNTKFLKEKEVFIAANKESNADTLSADKMSEFYKKFLDENWQSHFNYNRDWYQKNFELLILSYRTKFQLKRWLERRKS